MSNKLSEKKYRTHSRDFVYLGGGNCLKFCAVKETLRIGCVEYF